MSPFSPVLRAFRILCRGFAILVFAGELVRAEPTNHWAYTPLIRPVPPATKGTGNPVDAFLQRGLDAAGIPPGPEADRRTWLRRVTFDVLGLPPTVEELRAFEQDRSPQAYEKVVDRLLASPRYGERWARHWMDASHFAETHGHDQDRMRLNAWPYRDYLVAAFNTDKPYSRFIQEQVAGDVLFPQDPWATVALGFLAAGPWDESSLRDIREDTLDRQIGRYLDRDDMLSTVMSVVTSSTVHCARCHDHKFDPIPQADYYALQSVFAGVDRANRVWDADPAVHARRRALSEEKRRIDRADPALLDAVDTQRLVTQWEAEHESLASRWAVLDPETCVATGGTTLRRLPDLSWLAEGTRPERDTYVFTAKLPSRRVTALRLEVLTDEQLPHRGPGRAENGNLHLSEIEVHWLRSSAAGKHGVKLVCPSADFDQTDWTIVHALDGNERTAWGIHPQEGQAHQAIFEFQEPLDLADQDTLIVTLKQLHGEGHLIGRFRVAVTDQTPPVKVAPVQLAEILALPPNQRSAEQQRKLTQSVLRERVTSQLAALPPPAKVYAAASDFEPDGGLKPAGAPREVHRLKRGEITKPLEIANPGALSCVADLSPRFELASPSDEGSRRAALAQWLTSTQNPLTWRSVVNRVWQEHFGRGLVDTPNDFGRLGSKPSHPELLDWLAVWFRDDAQGSFKALDRLLLTSAAYRRSSVLDSSEGGRNSAQLARVRELDPENRLWSHMNRQRLDAECIRDAVLQFNDRLDLRMGGASDQQFDVQPGIHVTPRVDYAKFDLDSAAGARRGVYRFLFRTLPDPFMEALDCPAGDQLVALRQNAVTVQQALALWNNAFMTRQAEHWAATLRRAAPDPAEQVALACEEAWGRRPTAQEAQELGAYVAKHGLANLGRLLLNSNEFIFLN